MSKARQFTQHATGSFKELLAIALPLMGVSISENVMIFIDRILLSHYSLTSLNAVTLASQAIEIFQYALWAIAGMTEIFVVRLYASKRLSETAKPCWQMIYLSLLSLPIIFLLSVYSGAWVLHGDYQVALPYYQLYIYSVPLIGIVAALSGFFIGRGRLALVVISGVVINLINLCLDVVLIFGVGHAIPALGPTGAAISAIISLLIQAVWLLIVFLNRHNRSHYSTHRCHFDKRYFFKCIRVGFPLSISHIGEMLGWFVLIKIISFTSVLNFTLVSLGNTLFLIFGFCIDGLYRALSTIIGHHEKLQRHREVKKSLYFGLVILLFVLILIAGVFGFTPDAVLRLFNLHIVFQAEPIFKNALVFIWVYFLLTGLFWVIAARLAATYKTKFIMSSIIFSMWLFTILPLFIIVQVYNLKAIYIWPIICIYALVSCVAVFLRSMRSNTKLV